MTKMRIGTFSRATLIAMTAMVLSVPASAGPAFDQLSRAGADVGAVAPNMDAQDVGKADVSFGTFKTHLTPAELQALVRLTQGRCPGALFGRDSNGVFTMECAFKVGLFREHVFIFKKDPTSHLLTEMSIPLGQNYIYRSYLRGTWILKNPYYCYAYVVIQPEDGRLQFKGGDLPACRGWEYSQRYKLQKEIDFWVAFHP